MVVCGPVSLILSHSKPNLIHHPEIKAVENHIESKSMYKCIMHGEHQVEQDGCGSKDGAITGWVVHRWHCPWLGCGLVLW